MGRVALIAEGFEVLTGDSLAGVHGSSEQAGHVVEHRPPDIRWHLLDAADDVPSVGDGLGDGDTGEDRAVHGHVTQRVHVGADVVAERNLLVGTGDPVRAEHIAMGNLDGHLEARVGR